MKEGTMDIVTLRAEVSALRQAWLNAKRHGNTKRTRGIYKAYVSATKELEQRSAQGALAVKTMANLRNDTDGIHKKSYKHLVNINGKK